MKPLQIEVVMIEQALGMAVLDDHSSLATILRIVRGHMSQGSHESEIVEATLAMIRHLYENGWISINDVESAGFDEIALSPTDLEEWIRNRWGRIQYRGLKSMRFCGT
jgi:hypothetical protein